MRDALNLMAVLVGAGILLELVFVSVSMLIWWEQVCSFWDILTFRDLRGAVSCSGYHFWPARALGGLMVGAGILGIPVLGLVAKCTKTDA
jgi:hypothetical protein